MKMKISFSYVNAALAFGLLLTVLNVPVAHAIKKCQDAEGKWHYGDVAVAECENSKVTTLNDRGFISGEQAAPKTEEQLEAERLAEAKAQAEKDRARKKVEERNRILSVYQTEADIDRQLDNQVYSVNSNIAVHNVYLKGMRQKVERLEQKKTGQNGQLRDRTQAEIDVARIKIEESLKELENLKVQKKAIQERFAREKELFRTLKSESAS